MESVWDYPQTLTLVPESRLVRVEFAGTVVAETTEAVRALERGLPPSFYIPPGDTRSDLLVACEGTSLCPVKGEARYWNIAVGDRTAERAAWSYPAPFSNCAALRGY